MESLDLKFMLNRHLPLSTQKMITWSLNYDGITPGICGKALTQ